MTMGDSARFAFISTGDQMFMFADDRMSMGDFAKYTFIFAGGWMSMDAFVSPPKKSPNPLQPAWPEMCRHAWTAAASSNSIASRHRARIYGPPSLALHGGDSADTSVHSGDASHRTEPSTAMVRQKALPQQNHMVRATLETEDVDGSARIR